VSQQIKSKANAGRAGRYGLPMFGPMTLLRGDVKGTALAHHANHRAST
jgi:hypothetical protein